MISIVLALNDRESAEEQIARLKGAGFRKQTVWVQEHPTTTSKESAEALLFKLGPGRFCVASTWGLGPD